MPKSRACYICGRQYLVHSFAIHEAQCRALFEQWEMQKPKKDRQPCPSDPTKKHSTLQEKVRAQSRSEPGTGMRASDFSSSTYPSSGDNKNFVGGAIQTCQSCGRTFNPASFSKHAKICVKVFCTKRKPFNSSKQRIAGTDMEQFVKRQKKSREATATHNTNMSNWKIKSNNFRAAMKEAKAISQAEKVSRKTGIPLHTLLDNRLKKFTSTQPDLESVRCPHCNRTFSQLAGERHIPQCQNIINKPCRLVRGSGAPSLSISQAPSAHTLQSLGARSNLTSNTQRSTSYQDRTCGQQHLIQERTCGQQHLIQERGSSNQSKIQLGQRGTNLGAQTQKGRVVKTNSNQTSVDRLW